MLKIWRAEVRSTSKAFLSLHEAKKWCEDTGSYNPDHPVRWHTSGEVLELRANFLIGTITPMPVQESEERYTGEITYLNIKYPYEKLERGMCALFRGYEGALQITFLHQVGNTERRITTNQRQFLYESYQWSIVKLDDAIRLEDDPLKKLAYQILKGDPQACDAARDVLKC